MVGYASATCLAWHLLLLGSKDVGLRVWLSLSGFSLNQKWGECCTLLHSVITLTLKPFSIDGILTHEGLRSTYVRFTNVVGVEDNLD